MLKYNYKSGLNHYRISRRLSEDSGGSCSFPERNDSLPHLLQLWFLPFFPLPCSLSPHRHFLSYTFTVTWRRKEFGCVVRWGQWRIRSEHCPILVHDKKWGHLQLNRIRVKIHEKADSSGLTIWSLILCHYTEQLKSHEWENRHNSS